MGLFWLRGDVVLKCEHLHLAAHTSSQGINALQDVSLHKTTARPGPWHPSRFNVFSWVLHPQPSLGNFSSPRGHQQCYQTANLSGNRAKFNPLQKSQINKICGVVALTQMCSQRARRAQSPCVYQNPSALLRLRSSWGVPGVQWQGTHRLCSAAGACSRCLRNQPRKEKKFGLCPSSLTQSVHGVGRGGEWGCATSAQHPSSTV